MPTLPLPLFTRSYKGVDESVLTDDAAVQYNGYLDALEGLNVRPGEVLSVNTNKQNNGLYMWPDKDFIVCVDETSVTLRRASENILTTLYSGGSVNFTGNNPVIFCNDATNVFMAGGGKINYVNATGTVTVLADTDAPIRVTHVAFLDGYILAINSDDSKFYWSDIPTNTDWSALSFASAEANPDYTQGLYVVQRQIYLLGTITTEIWENDGSTPFSRIPGGLIEIGCAAKYSPIKRGNSLMWLSHTREFVEFTGTDVKFISSQYDPVVANFDVVSDCIGTMIIKDGQQFCLFHFPTENRTLAYNPKMEDWSEWGTWSPDSNDWVAYDVRSSAHNLKSGRTFIGKQSAKVITCLDSNSRVDYVSGTSTRPFKFLRKTGFIDHSSSVKKRIEEIRFRAKRGASYSPGTPKLMFRYRNDGSSQWSNIDEIDLGAIGDNVHHIKLKRLGMCVSRQYEISATDDIPVVLSNAEIDLTILR